MLSYAKTWLDQNIQEMFHSNSNCIHCCRPVNECQRTYRLDHLEDKFYIFSVVKTLFRIEVPMNVSFIFNLH